MEKIPQTLTAEEKLALANKNLADNEKGMNAGEISEFRTAEVAAIASGEATPTAFGMEFEEIQNAFVNSLREMSSATLAELAEDLKNTCQELSATVAEQKSRATIDVLHKSFFGFSMILGALSLSQGTSLSETIDLVVSMNLMAIVPTLSMGSVLYPQYRADAERLNLEKNVITHLSTLLKIIQEHDLVKEIKETIEKTNVGA